MKLKLLYTIPLFTLFFLNYSNGQQTFVPDAIFEQYLIDQGYDTTLDSYVPTNNINTITSIDLSAKGISSLEGIEDFTALTSLDISENTLLSSINLNNNTSLIHLNAWNTSINSINLVNNTNLEYLNIYNTLISSIDVNINTSLDYINVANTMLTSLDITNNTLLNYLNISETNISNLDVKNSLGLNYLLTNNTPNLSCITVMDEVAAAAGTGIYADWEKDVNTTYNENCALSTLDFNTSEIYVGPNPIKEQLFITLKNSTIIKEVIVFDITGKLLLTSVNTVINTSQLNSGVYLIKIKTNTGSVTKKLIKD